MIDRRKFLSNAAGLTAVAISPLEELFASQPSFKLPAGFSLTVMGTNWGFQGSMDQFCAKAKAAGYDGVELWWPNNIAAQKEMLDALKKHNLEVGFLAGGSDKDPAKHFEQFKQMFDGAVSSTQRPLYINCHSGRDYFSMDENAKFIDYTTKVAKQTGITVCHETHRSRILFAAHVAKEYLKKHPDLRVTLDISHWCNVHESLLHDQEETVQLALERTDHVHIRVGHSEGPQVNDPRAPEWADTLKRHFEWWDAIVQMKIKNGTNKITMLTEFGPPHYLPALPYTQQPVADQWGINEYMMQLIRKRYQKKL